MNKYVKQLNDNSLVVQVVLNGSRLKAVDKDGNSHKVPGYRRQAAFDNNEALACAGIGRELAIVGLVAVAPRSTPSTLCGRHPRRRRRGRAR